MRRIVILSAKVNGMETKHIVQKLEEENRSL